MAVSPPRPKGPPLNALRAFEAAARLGGFAAAAEELCVTPGAVAQHVKALEAWAGADLFERRSQGVRLTVLGSELAADFSAAFDRLGEAVHALRSRAMPREVRIAALPSVAQLWLAPRQPALRTVAADVAISITASEVPPNLRREPFDLCVFFQDGPPARGAVDLGADSVFPVCAPAVAARIASPADLAQETFLHDASWAGDWAVWLAEMAPDTRLDTRGPTFSLYALAVEEAVNGAGVLIGHEPLVSRHLASGTLVDPFGRRFVLDRHLTIERARTSVPGSATDRIVKWLASTAGG
jgi:LysR family glycine cleavage system transcriptional activator